MERGVSLAPAAPGMGDAKGSQRIGQMFLFIPGVESGAVGWVCHDGAHHEECLGHAGSPESGTLRAKA